MADGTVYFRVKKFKEYRKTIHKNLDDLQSGFRALQVSGERAEEIPSGFCSVEAEKRSASGRLLGVRVVQGGISSVQLCPKSTWEKRLISMRVERI